jgi:hypothetical protein
MAGTKYIQRLLCIQILAGFAVSKKKNIQISTEALSELEL